MDVLLFHVSIYLVSLGFCISILHDFKGLDQTRTDTQPKILKSLIRIHGLNPIGI